MQRAHVPRSGGTPDDVSDRLANRAVPFGPDAVMNVLTDITAQRRLENELEAFAQVAAPRRVFKLLQPPAPPAPSTPLGDRPPVIATAGRMIHCNTPAGMPVLT